MSAVLYVTPAAIKAPAQVSSFPLVEEGPRTNIVDREDETQANSSKFWWECLGEPSARLSDHTSHASTQCHKTNVDAAIDEVPVPAPRSILPRTNTPTFGAAVLTMTPLLEAKQL